MDEGLRIGVAAQALGVSVDTLRRWERDGRIVSSTRIRHALLDGRAAVLKIRRPGIEKVVQADLDILRNLAHLTERRIPWLAAARPVALAKEFERNLKRELDLNAERRTMERCRLQLANEPFAHVPEAIDALSTSRVLTMERIDGVG
ncbi:MAG: MerR family DNA-binding transcriptional regulator, partial [Actinobacteria bacterium]|nr:MerR family DNA-binding transcriptional regulator [Actinomycetota bacterium]